MAKECTYVFLAPPPVQSLLYWDSGLWPHTIVRNAKRWTRARDRLFLSQTLEPLFDKMKNLEMTEAIDAGLVDPEDAIIVYRNLAWFLETDSLHKRLVLYLPFEILPHKLWQHSSAALQASVAQFLEAYLKHWAALLTVADVRASFVDGDVPEPELHTEPIPRVAKAAHLIPMLAAKGLISVQRVLELLEYPEGILVQSIMDTFPVLADLGLMSREKAAELTKYHTKNMPTSPSIITPERAHWLKQEGEKYLVEARATDIARGILTDASLSPVLLEKAHYGNAQTMLAIIHGIRMVAENLGRKKPEEARWLYSGYERILLNLWQKNIPEVRDGITSAWSRLLHLHVLDQEDIERLGVFIPDLEAGFAKNKKLIEQDAEELKPAIERMYHDPNLARLLYPVCILFGSRVKGYGTTTADLDVAVFVRPGVHFEERPRLQKHLKELFKHKKVNGKVMEFWLEQKDEGLAIRDFPHPDTLLGDSMLVHVLFGGAWYGEMQTIRELHEKVLHGYLYEKDSEKRRIWLEELERDTLLYRLLHKGYARFFPEQGGVHTPHADWIDGQSMFYDSGYRRLATKLFIRRVFLPKLG